MDWFHLYKETIHEPNPRRLSPLQHGLRVTKEEVKASSPLVGNETLEVWGI